MKTAVITGASQGLGRVLALKLAQQQYQVLLIARSPELLSEVVAEITASGGRASHFVCDLTDLVQVTTTVQQIQKKSPQLEILINNAGIWTDDALETTQPEQRAAALNTNLLGQINLTEQLLPALTQTQVTRILNVISTAGVEGIPAGNNTAWKTYGASKWGFKGYTSALRESLRETSIQVLQFFPGGFDSNLYENAGRSNPHHQPWMMKTEDVADVAIFALTRPDDVYMEQVVVSKHYTHPSQGTPS